MQINVETFEAALRARGIKQADLARKARLGAKTVGRIRRGEDLRRSNVEKIAAALDMPVEALLEPPSADLSERAAKKSGMQRLVIDLPTYNLNQLSMAQYYYGVSIRALIEWAPLLFTLVAEMSLTDRRKKLNAWLESVKLANKSAPGRHEDELAALNSEIDDLYWAERHSIDRRDLAGGFSGEHHTNEGGGHALLEFVEHLANSIEGDLEFIDATHEEPGFVIYGLLDVFFGGEEHLVDRDQEHGGLAIEALNRGDVLLRDIPDELLAKDKLADRVRWLASFYGGANGDLDLAIARSEEHRRAIDDVNTELDGGDDEQASA